MSMDCWGWVDLGRVSDGPQAALSLPLYQQDRKEIAMKRMGVQKRTGRSLTSYCHGKNWVDLGKLILLIYKFRRG